MELTNDSLIFAPEACLLIDIDKVKSLLDLLSNDSVLNGGFLKSPGLMDGRLGLSLTMFLIADKQGLGHLSSFANDLLEEVYLDIDRSLLCDYDSGAIGISVYFYLLKKYDYAEVVRSEIMGDLDLHIYQHIIKTDGKDHSLNTGLLGMIYHLILKLDDEEDASNSSEAYICKEMLISCLDELLIGLPNELIKISKESLIYRIQIYNLLSRVVERIYPSVVESILKILRGEEIEKKFTKAWANEDRPAVKSECVYLFAVYSYYMDRSVDSLKAEYQIQTDVLFEQYLKEGSVENAVSLLEMILTGLDIGMYLGSSDVKLSALLSDFFTNVNVNLICSSNNYSLVNGIGKLMLLLEGSLSSIAFNLYKELIFLEVWEQKR